MTKELGPEEIVVAQPLQLIMVGLVKEDLVALDHHVDHDAMGSLAVAIEDQLALGVYVQRLPAAIVRYLVDGLAEWITVPHDLKLQLIFAVQDMVTFWVKFITRALRIKGVIVEGLVFESVGKGSLPSLKSMSHPLVLDK